MPSKKSQNRLNNEKNLAIKNQLALSHRLQIKCPVDLEPYKIKASREIFPWQLPDICLYFSLLNYDPTAQIVMVEKMTFNNFTLKKDAVIMIPGEEERKLFVIHVIVKDTTGLVNIVTREMTQFTDYCEHYQGYKLLENFRLCESDWRCFTLCDLDDASFSFISVNGMNETCIPKRWI